MSKVIDLSAVTDASRIAIKQGTLAFMQDAHKETTAATIIALIGAGYNPATVYVLYGCVNTGVGLNYIISAGAIFYNGEVYNVDATAFTVTGSNVPVFTIAVTQFTTNADPMTFTDGTVRNIHNIRKIVISAGASGSGIADYLAGYFLSFNIPAPVSLSGAGVTGAYPNYVIPGPNGLLPVLAGGDTNVGDVSPGTGTDIVVTFLTPLTTANYRVQGTVITNGDPTHDVLVVWGIRNRTNTGFTIHFQELAGVVQNISFEWMAFAKA